MSDILAYRESVDDRERHGSVSAEIHDIFSNMRRDMYRGVFCVPFFLAQKGRILL